MINIYTQIPFKNDCIAVLHGCDCLELLVGDDFYDEYKEPFIVFAGIEIKEINEYLLFVKQKVAWLTKLYGKYADFEVKPIFAFKDIYSAQHFLRIYESRHDKKLFVAEIKKKFNLFYEVEEIKEKFLEKIDDNNKTINLFENNL